MKVNPVFNTEELTNYFYKITEEVFDYIDFIPKTYLNTYIYKPDTSIETIYNGMSGKSNDITWEQRTKTFELDSGILYYIYFDYDNSEIGKDDWLHTYAFVHKDMETKGKYFLDKFKSVYPNCGKNIWFSYMKDQTYFDWHIDGPMYRYHQVIKNDKITPSFTTEKGDVYAEAGDAFIEYAGELHKVKPNTDERLHIVSTIFEL